MTDAPQDPISGNHDSESAARAEADEVTNAGDATTAPYGSYGSGETQAPAGTQSSGQSTGQTTTQPLDSDRSWTATTLAPDDRRRSNKVGIIAALAVGALVGGVSGAGVAAWAVSANQSPSSGAVVSRSPQNITVNNTDDVSVITAVAAKASPSVVTISVTSKSAAGTGSGVILTSDGYILTNTHVVTLDGEIANPAVQVTTSDGHLYDATIVGTDPIADLAVIKLKNASGLNPASFADSSKLNVGQTAVAIGAPLGLDNTVTNGIVSALNRSISIASSAAPNSSGQGDSSSPNPSDPFNFKFDNGSGSTSTTATATISLPVIQTDAAINPGNSGGALLNSDAKVIGINVAIASAGSTSTSTQSGSIGVGFAIPSNLAQRVANEIMKNGKATHGLLGASVTDVTSTDSSSVVGADIKTVSGGGSADKAGIKAGDVITSFNGVPITSSTDLTAEVRSLAAGSSTSLTYVRGGKSSTVDVTLGALQQ